MSTSTPQLLWEHPAPETTAMARFNRSLEQQTGLIFKDYDALHKFSCSHRSTFWRHAFTVFPLVWNGNLPVQVIDETARIDTVPLWFPGVKINYAQNVLYSGDSRGRPTTQAKEDDKIAITEIREGQNDSSRRRLTWKQLREKVGELASALRSHGVKKGDRIALVGSNSVETLAVLLATTSIGAVFSSSSADMGVKGILDRLLQIRPSFVFFDDWAVYNGKTIDLRSKIQETINGPQAITEFRVVVALPRFQDRPADVSTISRCVTWSSFVSASTSSQLVFEECDFSDPALIAFSSGTTGPPKCIVHAVGGLVLNGYKDSHLHQCIDQDSVQLQYTTTGWIMYLQVSLGLLAGAHAILYDGSPFYPEVTSLCRIASELKVTHLGVSPRYLEGLQKAGVRPQKSFDLSSLAVVTSTGMNLSNALFQWFYQGAFPQNVFLANLAGGTDIASCFAGGSPIMPLYSGGCQCITLGMDVQVFGSDGKRVEDHVAGELVCVSAFPTMPVSFFGEDGAKKYFDSYFAQSDGVWTHGDCIMIHPQTKQVIFLGRSDGVLNPSGIRFGSAEIYDVIDKYFPDTITDTICVGQKRPQDTNERVMLFVQMKAGHQFSNSLVRSIQNKIKTSLSPRHVPSFIFEVPEIPMTINMKKVELPVKQIVSGKIVKPSGTLLNAQSLEYFYQFADDKRLLLPLNAKI